MAAVPSLGYSRPIQNGDATGGRHDNAMDRGGSVPVWQLRRRRAPARAGCAAGDHCVEAGRATGGRRADPGRTCFGSESEEGRDLARRGRTHPRGGPADAAKRAPDDEVCQRGGGQAAKGGCGAPAPCTAPPPAVRASAIVSAPDDLALLEWLSAQAQAGQFVTSLAPLGNGDSIAALFGGPPSTTPGYTVTLVNGAPEPEGVKKRLALNPGKELIGLHVTSPTAFLLVLRDAPR